MKFKAKDLRELVYGGGPENLREISNNINYVTRWSKLHTLIFEDTSTNKFYKVGYSDGLTEYQIEEPFEYEDEVECEEVQKVYKIVESYISICGPSDEGEEYCSCGCNAIDQCNVYKCKHHDFGK